MFSANNLKAIRKDCGTSAHEKGEFIVGMKLGVFKNRHKEFYDRSHFSSLSDHLEIYETTHGEDRLIITWSQVRADRDRKTREDILEKITKKLKSSKADGKTFVSNTNYRKYVTGLNKGTPQLNKIRNTRPLRGGIVYWTDKRIIGHLTLCFLAYFCEAQITKLLRQQHIEYGSHAVDDGTIDPRPLTFSSAMLELKEVRVIPMTIQGKVAWVRTDIKGNAAKIFKAIGIAIPPKLLKLSLGDQLVKNTTDVVPQTI